MLIERFCSEFAHAGEDLRGHLERGEHRDAERLAHNLAGVASQLEATQVAQASRTLELQLRAGELDGTAALADRVAAALAQAVAAAQTMTNGSPSATL